MYGEAKAKLDEYASTNINDKNKYDSADIDTVVKRKISLIRKAEGIVSEKVAERLDSMSDVEIMTESIKAVVPNFDGAGKSRVYLEARFDGIAESVGSARKFARGVSERKMEKFDSETNSSDARNKMIKENREAWKQPMSSSVKR